MRPGGVRGAVTPMRLVLALLLGLALAPLAPIATADHSLCGARDGYVIEDMTGVWLRPGCLGVAAGFPPTFCTDDGPLVHGQVLVTQVYIAFCASGVWIP